MTIRDDILLSGGEVHVLPHAEATTPRDVAELARTPGNAALVERLVDGVAGLRAQSTPEMRARTGFGSTLGTLVQEVAVALHLGHHPQGRA